MWGRHFIHPMGFMVSDFAMAQMMDIVPPSGSEAEFRQLRFYVATQIAAANPGRDPRGIAIYADELVDQVEKQIKARQARKHAENEARRNFRERAQRLAKEEPEVVRLREERALVDTHRDELEVMRPKPPKKKWGEVEIKLNAKIDEDKAAAYQQSQKIATDQRLRCEQLERDHYYRLCNEAGIVPETL